VSTRFAVAQPQRSGTGNRSRGPVFAGLAALALVLALSGCKEVESASAAVYEPAKVEEIADEFGVKQVTLTEEGASRIDLATATAQQVGPHTVVPYAALIYDGQGASWVYISAQPLTFLRTAVVVDRIEGDAVLVSEGLRPGAEVVTVGAAEVYGAELGIAGGH